MYKNLQEFKRNMPSTKFRVKTVASSSYFLIDSNSNVITPSTILGFVTAKPYGCKEEILGVHYIKWETHSNFSTWCITDLGIQLSP